MIHVFLFAAALAGADSSPRIPAFDRRGWSDNDVCAYSEFGIGDADIGSRVTDNFIDAIYTIPDASGDVVGYVYHGSKGTFGMQGNEFISPAMMKSLNLHMHRFWSNEIRLSVEQTASLNPRPCSLRDRLHMRSRYVFYDAVARAFEARRLREAKKLTPGSKRARDHEAAWRNLRGQSSGVRLSVAATP